MTPEERYVELRKMTNNFKSKNMIKHHFIRHINEVLDDAAGIVEKFTLASIAEDGPAEKWLADKVRSLKDKK